MHALSFLQKKINRQKLDRSIMGVKLATGTCPTQKYGNCRHQRLNQLWDFIHTGSELTRLVSLQWNGTAIVCILNYWYYSTTGTDCGLAIFPRQPASLRNRMIVLGCVLAAHFNSG